MSPILDSIGSVKGYGFGALTSSPYWALLTSGGANTDYGQDITSDSSGNLYYVGKFNGHASIISVDSTGAFRWGKRIVVGSQTSSSLSCVRFNSSDGYIYASGGGSGGSNDAAMLVKYNTSGVQQWISVRAGSYAAFPQFAFDSSNNIYVVGQISGDTTTGLCVGKYNSSGVWQTGIRNNTGLGNCSSNGISVGSDGSIYVSGRSDDAGVGNGGTGNKALFLKFNSSFSNQFFKSIDNGTTSGRYNAGYATTQINSTGNIYITAYQSATSSGGVMSFDTSGTLQWARSITEGSGGGNFARITNDGTNIYASGYTDAGKMNWVKFDTSGSTLLSRKWSTSQNMQEPGIALSGGTNLALGGYSYINGTDTRQFASLVPVDGTQTGKTAVVSGLTYAYNIGTATIASYTPSIGTVSMGWTTLSSPSTYSTAETSITPTITKAGLA